MLPSRLGRTVRGALAVTKYPSPIRNILTRLPVDVSFKTGKVPEIHRGCRFGGNITLGDDVRVGPRSHLDGDVCIGRGTNLVADNEVIGEVKIGRYCAIARETTFQGTNHEPSHAGIQIRFYQRVLDSKLPHTADGPIEVGHDVWFGADATVLPGRSVGTGAIVGAKSVVTDDVPPYAIVAGVPAEVKGWRFNERTREQLLEIEWWNWSEERMSRNRRFFETNLQEIEDPIDEFDLDG